MLTIARFIAFSALFFTSVALADIGDNSVGLNAHVPTPDELDLAAASGVNWIRVDANWFTMNPARGDFNYGQMDAVVRGANDRGLSVFMTFAYAPGWVPRGRTGDDGTPNDDEVAGSAEWVAFVENAVPHFRALGVQHFGLWNEPNLEQFWDGDVNTYLDRILVPGSEAVRRVCDDCFVVGPDLAHIGDYDDFLEVVLERAMGSFDILAHHIYNDWPENGHSVFDGDAFLNALEMRRFTGAFASRISLRELLDEAGYDGEVWLTETGYEAEPPGDAGEEEKQATYVRRVLEEQLERDWWTHTFFYENTDCGIEIPGCSIDGFGITRPTRARPRAFPADYRLKPAYEELRRFIEENPEILDAGDAPSPACSDGRDNDGDGLVDLADPGCESAGDSDETDAPGPDRMESIVASVALDGSLDEWGDDGWVALDAERGAGGLGRVSAADLSVRAAARHDSGGLWLAFEVSDDTHRNNEATDRLWASDSVQVAFDIQRDGGDGYDEDDVEFTFALSEGTQFGVQSAGETGTPEVAIARDGASTIYEVRLPAAALPGVAWDGDHRFGFSFLVNEDDGGGREGWIEWTPGIGMAKQPEAFGELRLMPERTPPTPDAGIPDGGTDGGGFDAGSDAGGRDGGWSDAGGADGGTDDAGLMRPDIDVGGCACRTSDSGSRSFWTFALLAVFVLRRSSPRRSRTPRGR